MSPITTHLTRRTLHLLKYMVPRIYSLMVSFRIMIGLPLVLTVGFVNYEKILHRAHRSSSKNRLQSNSQQEGGNHGGHQEYKCGDLHQVSSYGNQKYITALQEVMVVMEVEAHMVLPVLMATNLTLLGG